ncbi:MAG: exonuclease SbcCD subunit D C-terminal domain-containing protein [Thermoguttaceae bacterium]
MTKSALRLLHTSDWHLGQSLFAKSRYEEFESFLDWLLGTIERESVDCLIVAGDIFDNTTPSSRSQELYFHFLGRLAASCCNHVVIIAGNHDSPALLDAPKTLLKSLQIHLIGKPSQQVQDHVLCLRNQWGETELICCAVPYLPERFLRKSNPGESSDDKRRLLIAGIREHYQKIVEVAREIRQQLKRPVPIIATGHLFVTGSQIVEGENLRDLYIGNLGEVGVDIFSSDFDYIALGHLHSPQLVAQQKHIRYSGSPLPLSFDEAKHQKSVVLLDLVESGFNEVNHLSDRALLNDRIVSDSHSVPSSTGSVSRFYSCSIQTIPVPTFQQLSVLRGDWDEIKLQIDRLKQKKGQQVEREEQNESSESEQSNESESNDAATVPTIWVSVEYEGTEHLPDLRNRLEQEIADSAIEILRVQNLQLLQNYSQEGIWEQNESLSALSIDETFHRCLQSHNISEEQQEELKLAFREITGSMK